MDMVLIREGLCIIGAETTLCVSFIWVLLFWTEFDVVLSYGMI